MTPLPSMAPPPIRMLAAGALLLFCYVVASSALSSREAFRAWAKDHNRSYAQDDSILAIDTAEFDTRFAIYQENVRIAEAHNAQSKSWSMSASGPFMDMTGEEFKERLLTYRPPAAGAATFLDGFTHADAKPPDEIDWREKGAVTEVKNQEQCGSCWAFSTTGMIEGAAYLARHKLYDLSEQELVDCDEEQQGCEGGDMYTACMWARERGLCSEEDYPYEAEQLECRADTCTPIITPKGCHQVPASHERSLLKAASRQPVSVAIAADKIMMYSGGVFKDPDCGTELDHGVLIVGYGVDSDEGEFWTVKNSWGEDWGEDGYIRIQRGGPAPEGECGINMSPVYASVSRKGKREPSTVLGRSVAAVRRGAFGVWSKARGAWNTYQRKLWPHIEEGKPNKDGPGANYGVA